MDGRAEILKILSKEPNKTFSTTHLVELVYPQEMRSIRDHQQFGNRQQKNASQLLKSKLHRKLLYHLNRLVLEQVLDVPRLDAHGEKTYRLAAPLTTASTKHGVVQIEQHVLRTPFLETELAEGSAHVYEERSTLARYNALYVDCASVEGLGQLTRILDVTLRAVNDVVCLGSFETMLARYRLEDIDEFLKTLAIQTFDESSMACLLLDVGREDVSDFVRLLSERLPKRLSVVFRCDQRSLQSSAFHSCVTALQERREKINVHVTPHHPFPLFIGRAGVYGVSEAMWTAFRKQLPEGAPCFVVSEATVVLDINKLSTSSATDARNVIMRAAKTLHGIASQQRLANTAVSQLSTMYPDVSGLLQFASTYLRLWNYDWERSDLIIGSVGEELARFVRAQNTVYRACGLPFDFHVQTSSAFLKAARGLSNRDYRKWTITESAELTAPAFSTYCAERLRFLRLFGNVDRFRIFRSGSPTAAQLCADIAVISQKGFPFITIDCEPLQRVRRLTEYFT